MLGLDCIDLLVSLKRGADLFGELLKLVRVLSEEARQAGQRSRDGLPTSNPVKQQTFQPVFYEMMIVRILITYVRVET